MVFSLTKIPELRSLAMLRSDAFGWLRLRAFCYLRERGDRVSK